jgi:hypothetical protein
MTEYQQPGMQPDAFSAEPNAEQEKSPDILIAESLGKGKIQDAREIAQKIEMPPDLFARKMMEHARAQDVFEMVEEMQEAGSVAEFLVSPETQAVAVKFLFRELSADRTSAAIQAIDLFQIPEYIFTAEDIQHRLKAAALHAMEIGDSTGSVELANRCKIDAAFLLSNEMKQAAIACRKILSTRSGAKIPMRIAKLEQDFQLPPIE